jgi:drug/metabolite transporter (DMT)-like permease
MEKGPRSPGPGAPSAALLAISAWGASFVATRVALGSFTPAGLVASRLLVGAALLLGILRLRRRPLLPEKADRPRCLLLGLVLAIHLLIQAEGLRHTTAINTGWIIAFVPVTIALGAWIFLGQPMRSLGWLGAAVASGGVLLVTQARLDGFSQAGFGDLLQVASCFTWTVYTLISVAPVARSGALRVTACSMTVAALLASTLAVGAGGLLRAPRAPELAAAAFLGLACSGGALVLWMHAQRRLGPTRTGAFLYLEPFVTLGVSAALLSEPLTLVTLLGGLTVLAGVRLVTLGSPR